MNHAGHHQQERRQHTNGVNHAHDLHDVSEPGHAPDPSHAQDASDARHAPDAPPRQVDDGSTASSSAAEQYLRALMMRVEGELQQHPIRTLGIAAGVGVGVGALLASRIVRMIVVTAGGYAAKELLRERVKAFLGGA